MAFLRGLDVSARDGVAALRRWRRNAIGGMTKPPAQLARVVAPPSHPYERGGGMRRLIFVASKRPRKP